MTQFSFTATVTSADNLVASATQPFTVSSSAVATKHMGCTLFNSDYPSTNTRWAAAQLFDTNMTRSPCAANWQKTYFSGGVYPGVGTTAIPADIGNATNGLIAKGVKIWLCYTPAIPFTTGDASKLVQSIIALQNIGWQGKVVIWQEPQDPNKGLTSAQFIPMFQSYYSYLKDSVNGVVAKGGQPVTVVYNSASNQGEPTVQSWYPGDAFCDEVAQDLYGDTFTTKGVTLGTLVKIATNAKPNPKPLNLGEFASSLADPSKPTFPTNAQVLAYFNYIQTTFVNQHNAGLPVGQVMYYNGDNSTTRGYWNIINSSSDFRVTGVGGGGNSLVTLYDALNF